MNFDTAFHKYRSYVVDTYKTNSVREQYIVEELSHQLPDESWKLVGQLVLGTHTLDLCVAQVWADGSVQLYPFS